MGLDQRWGASSKPFLLHGEVWCAVPLISQWNMAIKWASQERRELKQFYLCHAVRMVDWAFASREMRPPSRRRQSPCRSLRATSKAFVILNTKSPQFWPVL